MIKYRINKITKDIIEDNGNLGDFFFTEDWRVATTNEVLNIAKEKKIKELRENCQNYILSVYPIYKQLNIINPLSDYSNEDKFAMNEFIDNQRKICASKEEEINNATLETINNIAITFGD